MRKQQYSSVRRKHVKKKDDVWWLLVTIIAVFAVILIFNGAEVDVSDEIVNVGEPYKNEGTVVWLGMDFSDRACVSGEVDTSFLGTYKLEYSFFGKRYYKNVTVVDMVKPVFVLIGDENLEVTSIEEFVDPGFFVVDNYDKDLTNYVETTLEQISNAEYLITYSVSDSSGNRAYTQRHIKLKMGTVYLTFDDGPSTTITPQILDILNRNGIKATFFLVGYSSEKSDIVYQEYLAGHTIGLHGYSHDYSEIYTSIDVLMENFQKMSDLVYQTTGGYNASFVRFPGGSSNTVSKKYCLGIMSLAAQKVSEVGYTYFDWNVDSGDSGGADESEEIYENVVQYLQPGDNIVLMHDSAGHQATVDALQQIIDYCLENGYELKAIDSQTPAIHHGIAN